MNYEQKSGRMQGAKQTSAEVASAGEVKKVSECLSEEKEGTRDEGVGTRQKTANSKKTTDPFCKL
jgi:hypothetical protein